MVGADHHNIAPFQGHPFHVYLIGKQEVVLCVGELDDLIVVGSKKRVVIKNVFGNQCLPFSGFFHRLVEQDMVVDHNTNVPCKNEIRNRWENHLPLIGCTAEEYPCECGRCVAHQFTLHVITAS